MTWGCFSGDLFFFYGLTKGFLGRSTFFDFFVTGFLRQIQVDQMINCYGHYDLPKLLEGRSQIAQESLFLMKLHKKTPDKKTITLEETQKKDKLKASISPSK